MAVLRVRAVEADEGRARAIIAALGAENIAAKLVPRSRRQAAGPLLYVYSQPADRVADFCAELQRSAEQGIAVVVSYLSRAFAGRVPHELAHANLANWNEHERSFAGFRDLVLACRRLLDDRPRYTILSVADMEERRRSASVNPLSREEASVLREKVRRAELQQALERERARLREEESQRKRDEGAAAGQESRRNARLGELVRDVSAPASRSSRTTIDVSPPLFGRRRGFSLARGRRARLTKRLLLAAAGIGAAAMWYWRHDIAALGGAMLKMLGAAVVPPAPRPPSSDDIVDVSVFAPDSGRAGAEILVQVFLHALDAAPAAQELAAEADPETGRRGIATLATAVAIRQRVDILLDAPGLTVDEPAQYLIWLGVPRACQFLVGLPAEAAGRTCHLKVRVLLDSVPVGTLRFALKVGAPQEPTVDMRGDWAKRYRHAFLSYASSDRAEVLKRAQALKAVGIGFFHDLLSLEPGERWRRRLYEEIDRCDLFLLFWSSSAAASEWVVRESEYALDRQQASPDGMPDITPVVLEGPPVPLPPDSLKDIHFNDGLRYVIAAAESERGA